MLYTHILKLLNGTPYLGISKRGANPCGLAADGGLTRGLKIGASGANLEQKSKRGCVEQKRRAFDFSKTLVISSLAGGWDSNYKKAFFISLC